MLRSPKPKTEPTIVGDSHVTRVTAQRVASTNGGRPRGVRAGALQTLRNIHCNEKFVFNDENRAPSECGMFHVGPMRG